jgi:phage-related protein
MANSVVFSFIAKDRASKEAERVGKSFSTMGVAIGTAVGDLAVEGFHKLTEAIGEGFNSAKTWQTLQLKTQAVLKSTGNVAHLSVKGIQALAHSQQELSGVEEATIVNGENVLATFTNVRNGVGKGNDIFNQATKAALNMSSALGTDLQGAMMKIGKGLNDPIKGMTALQKIGVKLTDSQKELIKHFIAVGQPMKAQQIILGELEKKYGGAARAAGGGFNGAMLRLKNTISDTFRDLLLTALPTLTKFGDWLAKKLPDWIDTGKKSVNAFFAAFREGDVTSDGVVGGFERVGAAAHKYVIPAFNAIVSFGKGLLNFYRHHTVLVQSMVQGLLVAYGAFKIIIIAVKTYTIVQAALNYVLISNPIGLVIVALGALVGGLIFAYKRSETFRKIVDGAMRAVASAFDWLWSHAQATLNWITHAWGSVSKGATDMWHSVVGWFKSLPGAITSALGNLVNLLYQKGREVIAGLWNGLKNAWNDVTGWISGIAKWIADHKGPISLDAKLLVPHGNAIMHGFLSGLKSGAGKAWDFVKAVGGKTRSALEATLGANVSGSGVSRWSGLVLQMLQVFGQPASLLSTVLRRMNQESGGNPSIVNRTDSNWLAGTPSVGLMQVIGPTFRAFAGPYRNTGPFLYGSSINPAANLYASFAYALSRYGSLSNAFNRAGGYDSGGWLQPGYTLAYNGTGRRERVLTDQQWADATGDTYVTVKIGEHELTQIVDARVDKGIGKSARAIASRRG